MMMWPWLTLLALQFALGMGLGGLVVYLYLRRDAWRHLDDAIVTEAVTRLRRLLEEEDG